MSENPYSGLTVREIGCLLEQIAQEVIRWQLSTTYIYLPTPHQYPDAIRKSIVAHADVLEDRIASLALLTQALRNEVHE